MKQYITKARLVNVMFSIADNETYRLILKFWPGTLIEHIKINTLMEYQDDFGRKQYTDNPMQMPTPTGNKPGNS